MSQIHYNSISYVIRSVHTKFGVTNIFPSIIFNFWQISLIIHENDVIMVINTKKKPCSTNTTILQTHWDMTRRIKIFVEDLHSVVTYPLHYRNVMGGKNYAASL